MGHQQRKEKRRRSSIDTGSSLYYYWSGGPDVDKVGMKEEKQKKNGREGEVVVTTVTAITTNAATSTSGSRESNNSDDDLFIKESVCDGSDGCGSCGIRCFSSSYYSHDHQKENFPLCRCAKRNSTEGEIEIQYGNRMRACDTDENKTIHETKMFRCNGNEQWQAFGQQLLSPAENRISVFPSNRFCKLARSSGNKVSSGSSSSRDNTRRKSCSSNTDTEKMVRKRKKNSLTPGLTTATDATTTACTATTSLSYPTPFSSIKDSEWKKKKKCIKRDTDEVDTSSVDESVSTPLPLLPSQTTAVAQVPATLLHEQFNSTAISSSCLSSPLNNSVSCFTSWPSIVEKYIRLGHLFMTPEAKSVPFRESSKTLVDDSCSTTSRTSPSTLRGSSGDHQVDVGKNKQQYHAKDNYQSYLFACSTSSQTQPTTVQVKSSPSILMKEKEFVQVDLLESSYRYVLNEPISNNNNNSKNSYRHQQEKQEKQQHDRKTRVTTFSSRFLPVFWIIAFVTTGSWINPCFAQGPVIEVQAVAHKKAILPCDMNAPISSDDAILVLWYKDLGDMPIYSYDGRNRPGTHAKNEVLLGQRAYFRTVTEPAALQIDNVSENDAGLYRCRVDFLKSPTRNSKVNLTVIVPPQKPTIFDGQARELGGIAGPFNEGSSMTLTCIASGGRPSPKVTWWRGGSLIDETFQVISSDGAIQNTMTVQRLSRADLHAVYTCQASNTNLSEPISSTIQVEMYFRPLEVTLLGSNQPMSALQEIEIVCQSVGSRPPAEISWYKDGQHLKSSREEVSPTGNISTSVLKLTPRVGDHGKSLTCRAENTRLEGSALEDSWKLAVFFVPILTLKLGSNLDPDNIREGGDVYLECIIHANPWVYKVVWEHNGHIVQHNASAGIIMSNQSLVLQRVRRASGGTYVCTATNIEGEGRSNPVELSVMYKPICKSEQKRIFGVAKGEQVEIECKVDANPKAKEFRWAFNNSADSIDVPQARLSTPKLGSSSVLRYTPHTELDYGSVVCLATNDIGQQLEPCVFHIIAAGFKMRASVTAFGHGIYRHHYIGKPDPPFNCTAQNITSESLEVECMEGFDGGLPQVFHADIVDAGTSRLLWNLTSQIPFFVINGLKPGQALRVFVHASNRKGSSENFSLEAQTIQEAEKRTASPVDFELTPILGVCVGVVCGLLVVALGIVLALKFRTDTRHPPPLKATKTEYRVEVNDSEEKNPDIIPSSKDSDYFYNDGLYNGPKRNGSITENFRNCTYYSDKSNSEITYAELCLDAPGPNGNPGMIGPGGGVVVGGGGGGNIGVGSVVGGGGWSTVDRKRRRNPMDDPASNSVIYATIDHSRMRTNGEPPAHLQPHQREIVSVRTPLLVNSQQESCV